MDDHRNDSSVRSNVFVHLLLYHLRLTVSVFTEKAKHLDLYILGIYIMAFRMKETLGYTDIILIYISLI